MPNEPWMIIVDDDEFDREIIKRTLKNSGCEWDIVEFSDGEELISFFQSSDTTGLHLILLDLNMPRISGMEALHFLHQQKKYVNIIKVIFSTSSNEKDMERSKELGAHQYIIKPSSVTGYAFMAEEVKKYMSNIAAP